MPLRKEETLRFALPQYNQQMNKKLRRKQAYNYDLVFSQSLTVLLLVTMSLEDLHVSTVLCL